MKTQPTTDLRIAMDYKVTDIQMLCDMIKAIESNFSAEYVDVCDDQLPEKILCEIDIYRGLFNTICHLRGEIRDAADELELMLLQMKKATA